MNPWEESWDTKGVNLSFDDALKAEGLTGKAADIARSIYQQESSSGKNTKTSNAGAVGGMQIIPATFKSVADKDWDINDPFQNSRAGIRYVKQLFEKAGGDPALTAAGYYGGPGGLEKARRGVAVSDPRNPNAPTTLQYGQQVAARLPKEKGLLQRGVEAMVPSAQAAETPSTQAKMPWEEQWEAPAATEEAAPKPTRDKTAAERIINTVAAVTNPVGGLVDAATGGRASIGGARGIKDVIDTGAGYLSRLGGADEQARVQAMNQEGKQDFQQTYGDSTAANVGRLAGNIVATVPLTNALGAGVTATGATRLGNAIASGGMSTGARVAPGAANLATDLALRSAGSGIGGYVVSEAVQPGSGLMGAAIGAVTPPVLKGLGAAGSSIARTIRGPEIPPNLLAAASQAQEAGYVIPPTQVKPSLGNRLLEGMSGKITTAQNASARNQEVTNRLAKQAIGADELSPEGLAMVRSKANQAYSDLGNFGTIKADDAFAKVVRDAGQRAEGFAKDFPELVNKDVEQLVESFANKKTFDSQSAIEAIKRLREGQRAISGNPQAGAEAKAFGRTQGKLADAVESLVERNLAEAKRPELLTAFRDARKTLARVYDVEKAMNPASGTVDARKLGNALKKGRLSDELKTAAEFGQAFPKAAQAIEGMGSLPQLSPLDWATAGGMSAATGSPLGALGLVARPAARATALSPFVQNRLAQPQGLPMLTQNARQNLLQPLYRSGPVLASDR